jgi:hypothetical protein
VSLVLILCVFHVHRVYRGSIFFSLVLILRIPVYLGINGDHFFSDFRIFFCACFSRKLPRYVPYKGTYVPYDGTYGMSNQGQMLDVCRKPPIKVSYKRTFGMPHQGQMLDV